MELDSYVRIYNRGGKVGLHLVNNRRHDFILYAKPLNGMVKQPGTFVRVKHRNQSVKDKATYHLGEIWGVLDVSDERVARITLFLGSLSQDIKLNHETGEPENVVGKYVFAPAMEDFETMYNAIALMVGQNALFEDLLDDVGVYIEI